MTQKKLPLINSAHGSETRNIINELIKLFNGMGYTYNESLQKAKDVLNEAERTNRLNNNTNSRLDKIIADSGTSSTEVVDARGNHTILRNRLNDSDERVYEAGQAINKLYTHPLYVETLVSFGKYGTETPSGVTAYDGGNYILEVDGIKGNDFFTVKSGDISSAGKSSVWAAILQNKDLTYEGYQVTGTDGVSKIFVHPNVRNNVTGVKLGNLHDKPEGQHYTELGYKAFGQHIFNQAGYYAQRNNYIARFLNTDTTGGWKPVGSISGLNYNRGLSPIDLSSKLLVGDNDRGLTFNTTSTNSGLEWDVPVGKGVGYFEGNFSVMSGGPIKVDIIIDGIVKKTVTIEKEMQRIICDFNYSDNVKVKVTSTTTNATTTRIGNCYFWKADKVLDHIFNRNNKKAVFLGDSWGTYHNGATPKEIQRLWNEVNPDAIVVNKSQGGMTTKYARIWFDEYVIKEKPDILILEYFTNDINTILVPSNGLDRIGPDGETYNTRVTEKEYFENIRYMVDMAIQNNIQPVVIMPSTVAAPTQTQYHSRYASNMQNGGSIIPEKASFKETNSELTSTDKIFTDTIETKTEFNKAMEIVTSFYGLTVKPRIQMSSGSVLKILNNNGDVLAQFNAGTLSPHQMRALELTGLYAEQGLHLPNSQIVDAGSIFKIKAKTQKRVSKIEIGEGVEGLTEFKTPIQIGFVDSLPTATQFTRYQEVILRGGVGVADKRYICIKNANDYYEWKEL